MALASEFVENYTAKWSSRSVAYSQLLIYDSAASNEPDVQLTIEDESEMSEEPFFSDLEDTQQGANPRKRPIQDEDESGQRRCRRMISSV